MLEKLKTLPPIQALAVQVNGQVEKEGSEENEKKEGKKKARFYINFKSLSIIFLTLEIVNF